MTRSNSYYHKVPEEVKQEDLFEVQATVSINDVKEVAEVKEIKEDNDDYAK